MTRKTNKLCDFKFWLLLNKYIHCCIYLATTRLSQTCKWTCMNIFHAKTIRIWMCKHLLNTNFPLMSIIRYVSFLRLAIEEIYLRWEKVVIDSTSLSILVCALHNMNYLLTWSKVAITILRINKIPIIKFLKSCSDSHVLIKLYNAHVNMQLTSKFSSIRLCNKDCLNNVYYPHASTGKLVFHSRFPTRLLK